ncbi:oxidoreductase [Xylariaceae sp. FL0804]|nr:oxidoreductase [Xylariaceae sp. FL0804]
MSNLRVLVVGASVAGPTAAYWFARAGANVTIIERFPALRSGGQNIDIRTTGVSVMRKMEGMEAAVRANRAPIDGINMVRKSGKVFASMKPTGDPDNQTLVSEYEIFRDDLARILFDMTKSNPRIQYHFGEQVTAIQQQAQGDGPVTVEFANGLPSSQYDLVVACDGATSRTRALGLDCGVRDHVNNLNGWVAYFTLKKDLLNGSTAGHGYCLPGGRFVAVGPGHRGTNTNRAALISVYARDAKDATAGYREAARQGDDALRRFVAERFRSSDGWKNDEILDALTSADGRSDFYTTEMLQVQVPSLHRGRFVLVGDAGYASGPTGVGTSLAMTGAYVLAGEVGKHGGDVAAALRGYEEVLGPMLKEQAKIPPGIFAFMAPQTEWGLALRNIACTIGFTIAPYVSRFFGAAFNPSKNKIPDYEWVEEGDRPEAYVK